MYYTEYQDRYCGRNTEAFAKEALKLKIDISKTVVVKVEDLGGAFGMITGYRAREGGKIILPKPAMPPYFEVGDNNWYFHVYLVAQETVNKSRLGETAVFDMSFENAPTVHSFSKYLDGMYLPPKALSLGKSLLEARNQYHRKHKVNVYDAAKHALSSSTSESKLKEGLYLPVLFPEHFERATGDHGSKFIERVYN